MKDKDTKLHIHMAIIGRVVSQRCSSLIFPLPWCPTSLSIMTSDSRDKEDIFLIGAKSPRCVNPRAGCDVVKIPEDQQVVKHEEQLSSTELLGYSNHHANVALQGGGQRTHRGNYTSYAAN